MASLQVSSFPSSSASRDWIADDGALLEAVSTQRPHDPDDRCDPQLPPSSDSEMSLKTYGPGSRRFKLIFIIAGVIPRRGDQQIILRYFYFSLFLSGVAWCAIRRGICTAIDDLSDWHVGRTVKAESAALQILDAMDLALHFGFSQCVYEQIRHNPIPYRRFNMLVICGGALLLASLLANVIQFQCSFAVCCIDFVSDSIFMLPRLGTMAMLLSITKQHAENLETFIQSARSGKFQPTEYEETLLTALDHTQRRWDWFLVLTFLLTSTNLAIVIIIMNHEAVDQTEWWHRQNIVLPAWYSFSLVSQVFPIAEYNSYIKTAQENIRITGPEQEQLRDLILWRLLATRPPALKVAGIFNVTRSKIVKAVGISLGSQIFVYLKPFLF